ncbi:hypothetical protein CEUSTIGMA_g4704.t1 [Chlamydomonas eustigma]|uniref:Uncharacterized protein n=1 Tax=Chlamydomonas eustigma TaxID=1157962 RepID=A0A250X2G5_9CHLO|nr:hypothetical protein CEUSTIGMA_g4704.t1 [Chlamydomonas eustigma]|eukprot:GAX77258.1 hypothetical protein CEUSTIGMA_g4704.t1 [Chlamydomonas eustigma]
MIAVKRYVLDMQGVIKREVETPAESKWWRPTMGNVEGLNSLQRAYPAFSKASPQFHAGGHMQLQDDSTVSPQHQSPVTLLSKRHQNVELDEFGVLPELLVDITEMDPSSNDVKHCIDGNSQAMGVLQIVPKHGGLDLGTSCEVSTEGFQGSQQDKILSDVNLLTKFTGASLQKESLVVYETLLHEVPAPLDNHIVASLNALPPSPPLEHHPIIHGTSSGAKPGPAALEPHWTIRAIQEGLIPAAVAQTSARYTALATQRGCSVSPALERSCSSSEDIRTLSQDPQQQGTDLNTGGILQVHTNDKGRHDQKLEVGASAHLEASAHIGNMTKDVKEIDNLAVEHVGETECILASQSPHSELICDVTVEERLALSGLGRPIPQLANEDNPLIHTLMPSMRDISSDLPALAGGVEILKIGSEGERNVGACCILENVATEVAVPTASVDKLQLSAIVESVSDVTLAIKDVEKSFDNSEAVANPEFEFSFILDKREDAAVISPVLDDSQLDYMAVEAAEEMLRHRQVEQKAGLLAGQQQQQMGNMPSFISFAPYQQPPHRRRSYDTHEQFVPQDPAVMKRRRILDDTAFHYSHMAMPAPRSDPSHASGADLGSWHPGFQGTGPTNYISPMNSHYVVDPMPHAAVPYPASSKHFVTEPLTHQQTIMSTLQREQPPPWRVALPGPGAINNSANSHHSHLHHNFVPAYNAVPFMPGVNFQGPPWSSRTSIPQTLIPTNSHQAWGNTPPSAGRHDTPPPFNAFHQYMENPGSLKEFNMQGAGGSSTMSCRDARDRDITPVHSHLLPMAHSTHKRDMYAPIQCNSGLVSPLTPQHQLTLLPPPRIVNLTGPYFPRTTPQVSSTPPVWRPPFASNGATTAAAKAATRPASNAASPAFKAQGGSDRSAGTVELKSASGATYQVAPKAASLAQELLAILNGTDPPSGTSSSSTNRRALGKARGLPPTSNHQTSLHPGLTVRQDQQVAVPGPSVPHGSLDIPTAPPSSSSSNTMSTAFMTASGRPIHISEEAMAKGRRLIMEPENADSNPLNVESCASDYVAPGSARGSLVVLPPCINSAQTPLNPPPDSLTGAKASHAPIESHLSVVSDGGVGGRVVPSVAFTTGSGRLLTVSEEAMIRARRLLDMDSTTCEPDVTPEGPKPTREVVISAAAAAAAAAAGGSVPSHTSSHYQVTPRPLQAKRQQMLLKRKADGLEHGEGISSPLRISSDIPCLPSSTAAAAAIARCAVRRAFKPPSRLPLPAISNHHHFTTTAFVVEDSVALSCANKSRTVPSETNQLLSMEASQAVPTDRHKSSSAAILNNPCVAVALPQTSTMTILNNPCSAVALPQTSTMTILNNPCSAGIPTPCVQETVVLQTAHMNTLSTDRIEEMPYKNEAGTAAMMNEAGTAAMMNEGLKGREAATPAATNLLDESAVMQQAAAPHKAIALNVEGRPTEAVTNSTLAATLCIEEGIAGEIIAAPSAAVTLPVEEGISPGTTSAVTLSSIEEGLAGDIAASYTINTIPVEEGISRDVIASTPALTLCKEECLTTEVEALTTAVTMCIEEGFLTGEVVAPTEAATALSLMEGCMEGVAASSKAEVCHAEEGCSSGEQVGALHMVSIVCEGGGAAEGAVL